jgi:polar amino acid transport system substrate-binding protein
LTCCNLSFINDHIMKAFILSISVAILIVFTGACTQNEQDSLHKIRKRGQIRYAVSPGYIPFSFYNSNKELIGLDIDMANEIARRLDVKAIFIDSPWQNIIETLRSGACDAIVGSMAVTKERSELVSFSEPYYYSRSHLFVRIASPIKVSSEIKGKVIGCTRGTTYEEDASKLEAVNIILYQNDEEALQHLVDKRIDAVITDEILGMYAIKHRMMPIKPVGNDLRSEQIAIAVRKDDASLLKEINGIIKTMREKGIIRELSVKTAEGKYR